MCVLYWRETNGNCCQNLLLDSYPVGRLHGRVTPCQSNQVPTGLAVLWSPGVPNPLSSAELKNTAPWLSRHPHLLSDPSFIQPLPHKFDASPSFQASFKLKFFFFLAKKKLFLRQFSCSPGWTQICCFVQGDHEHFPCFLLTPKHWDYKLSPLVLWY